MAANVDSCAPRSFRVGADCQRVSAKPCAVQNCSARRRDNGRDGHHPRDAADETPEANVTSEFGWDATKVLAVRDDLRQAVSRTKSAQGDDEGGNARYGDQESVDHSPAEARHESNHKPEPNRA